VEQQFARQVVALKGHQVELQTLAGLVVLVLFMTFDCKAQRAELERLAHVAPQAQALLVGFNISGMDMALVGHQLPAEVLDQQQVL
jgi:thiol-disulfide isomerase/thioredoxin